MYRNFCAWVRDVHALRTHIPGRVPATWSVRAQLHALQHPHALVRTQDLAGPSSLTPLHLSHLCSAGGEETGAGAAVGSGAGLACRTCAQNVTPDLEGMAREVGGDNHA